MNPRLRAYLDLVRLPNLFTAAADVAAGFMCNGGGPDRWHVAAALAIASMCLYAGGVVLNDVCDAERDRLERPDRPIPSGRVARRTGFALSIVLLLIGVAFAILAAPCAGWAAGGIAIGATLYDVGLKTTPIGPLTMGVCRALNLTMGMLGASGSLAASATVPVVLMAIYVSSVTFFARDEAGSSSPWRLALGVCGVALAIVGLLPLMMFSAQEDPSGMVLAFTLLVFVGTTGRRAMRLRTSAAVQAAVKRFVLGIVLFDACVAWLGAGWSGALLVGLLFVAAMGFARALRVT